MTTTPLPEQAYGARTPRINPWLIRLPILFVTGVTLVVLVLLVFLVAFQMRYAERIVPGVQALGVDLSGMTLDEASAALSNRFEYGRQAVFTFRDGDRFWQLTAADLGVQFDASETAAAAFAIGHSSNIIRDLAGQSTAWVEGSSIAPVITYDQNVAVEQIQTIASTIDRDPVNASLSLDGLSVQTTDSQTGRRLDVAATLARLDTHIVRMDTGAEIPLVIHETPPAVISVAETANRLQTALSGALTLVATDQSGGQLGPWTVSVEQIASLLQVALVNNQDGTQSYTVAINMTAFEGFLNQLAPGLITPAVDGRFDFEPTSGQLSVVRPAQSGRVLNIAETLARLEAGVFTENRVVPMAFDYTLPRYHNQITAAELGIREIVAEATTYYEGSSQNRRTNIAVGVSRINGVIIAPGEEFSFNYHIGEISEANGYVEGLLIYGGRTIAGLGGGICQVSTNLFRAAYNGGFAITERNSHGYRVGYYELRGQPAGFDAAIWQPERDFRFQNNTPYHLLIEATMYPGDNAVQIRIYSTRHWQVQLEEPIIRDRVPAPPPKYEANRDLSPGQILQVDYAAEGADVTIYRNVYDLSGNLVIRDYAYTHYVPWQAIYQVAPGDSRLSANQG